MRKTLLAICALLAVDAAAAMYKAERTEELSIGQLEGRGQIQSPQASPDWKAISFEYLAASGDTLEIFLADVTPGPGFPPKLKTPYPAMGEVKQDVFSLGGRSEKPVSEQAVWGPPARRGTQLVFAATRREATRGGAEINFDLMHVSKGRKRFLTDHPGNDAGPAFSPDGEYVAFTSGRTGEGDIYVYSFFGEDAQLTRITFEESGSELYPLFSPDGEGLLYVGHMGGADHLMFIEKPLELLKRKEDRERMSAVRAKTRDLTAGSRHSSFAPSFSPDGKWVAFYVHPKGELRSDLYVVPRTGGEPRLLLERVLPGTRSGPCWSPDGDGIFAVEENAQEMNPIVWVPLDPTMTKDRLQTKTELNTDVSAFKSGEDVLLLFAAQGGKDSQGEKRWRRIFLSKLVKK